ncbi:MAG TPA: anti-sigma factor [Balneolaceae bacterium]|nr:anti-sigma factor [Balneolaceae bacterium]
MNNEKSHTEKFEELCAGYVLHALNEDERKEFEQMLVEASEEERLLFQEIRSAANQLAFAAEEAEPSDALKERLMADIRSQSGEESAASSDDTRFNWPAFSAAAAFALLIISLSLIFYSFNLSSEISRQEQVIDEQQTQIVELKNDLDQKEELLSILEAREVDLIMMSGLDVNPNGYGKIIWDSEKQQALLQVSNLPPIPDDKSYQLWIIVNNKPVSAGIFAVNEPGDSFFKVEEMADVTEQAANAFAVTLEPKGGVPQPTGDMYLFGNATDGG